MQHIVVTYLPYLLSAITIYSMLFADNKTRGAWLVGLVNQFLWLIYICAAQVYGLLPINIALNFTLWVLYGRNYIKWQQPPPPNK